MLLLQSSRTSRDYHHLSHTSSPGFDKTADKQLLDLLNLSKPKHLAKYVFILIDEAYVKEGLEYNKLMGSLIGFADLGGTLQQINDYKEMPSSGNQADPLLAKTMMVFMLRGVFYDISFPFAQFPMSSAQAHDVFSFALAGNRLLGAK